MTYTLLRQVAKGASLFLLFYFASSPTAQSQSQLDSLVILPVAVPTGQSTVSIQISLTNSIHIAAISGRMVFDSSIITPQTTDLLGGVSMERVGRGTALSDSGANTPQAGVVTFIMITAPTNPVQRINPGTGPICQINFNVLTTQDTTVCIRLEDDTDPLAVKNLLADTLGFAFIPSLKAGSLQIGVGSTTGGCIPAEPINDRGDLNLNGIRNEIADFILYENYFIYGDAVLFADASQRQAQIANSDVNADGLILRVSDLVFLGRIITGDANPLPRPSVGQQAASVDFQIFQEADRLLVSYDSPVDIGGLFLRLNYLGTAGDPARLDSAENIDYGSQGYPGELRVFMAGSFFDTTRGKLPAGSGPLLSIPFTGNLRDVEIQASTFEGLELATTGIFPIDRRGDFDADRQLTSSDVVLELYCIFQNPSPNCSPALADLNCDGEVTAADLVNILNATFLSEPLPACSP